MSLERGAARHAWNQPPPPAPLSDTMNAAARFRAAAVLILLAASGGCTVGTPLPLPVPEALSTTEPWPVTVRYRWPSPPRYHVGPYHVENVHHGDIRQRGGILDALKGKREYQQRYSFAVRDSAQEAPHTRVLCDGRDRDRGFSIGSVEIELGSGMSLECRVYLDGDTAAWVLKLGGQDGDPAAGVLEQGDTRYQISGELSTAEPGENFAPAYLVRRDSALVAMVYTRHSGLMRVSPVLEGTERRVVAAGLLALLFQQPLIDADE